MHLARQRHAALCPNGVPDLLGRGSGYFARRGLDRSLQALRHRSATILCEYWPAVDQGCAQGEYRRGDGARRVRFADDLPRQDRHVFRQRPPAAAARCLDAAKGERGVMPKQIVCRELGPPERLRLETFTSRKLAKGEVRAAGINFPDILMVAGEYQLKPDLPFTPGVEAAGIVTEIADGAGGVKLGDRVIVRM